MFRQAAIAGIISLAALSASSALGEEKLRNENVFIMGGPYTDQYIEHSLVPGDVTYDSNFMAGIGYQSFLGEPLPGVSVGYELGTAIRAGDKVTGEVWAAAVGRMDKEVSEDLVISPSISFGLSAVTGSMGTEAAREAKEPGGNAHLLFYVAPEIAISNGKDANTELFYRVHHRSGAWGTLGNMGSGYNAQVVGIRHHF